MCLHAGPGDGSRLTDDQALVLVVPYEMREAGVFQDGQALDRRLLGGVVGKLEFEFLEPVGQLVDHSLNQVGAQGDHGLVGREGRAIALLCEAGVARLRSSPVGRTAQTSPA